MTQEEIIQAQNEKLEKMEEMLNKASEGPYKLGVIGAGPDNGYYRISSPGGDDSVIIAHPDLEPEHLKKGATVLISEYMITSVLPDALKIVEPPIEFNLIKWEEIGGIKSQVGRIREAVEFPTKYAEYYKAMGMTPSKGVLLYGPPGVGKTMIAKAIASTILESIDNVDKNSFVYLKGGELLNPYVGVTEMKIKSIFENARDHFKKHGTRSVIFIDEAEAILPTRGSRRSSDVESTIVPTFLSEMDGFEDNTAFIILATNHPAQLDPAVIRPGRIDMKVEIVRPTVEDSAEIFAIHLGKTKTKGDIGVLSKEAAEYMYEKVPIMQISGALIANIVQGAAVIALKRFVAETEARKQSGINLGKPEITGIIKEDIINSINNL